MGREAYSDRELVENSLIISNKKFMKTSFNFTLGKAHNFSAQTLRWNTGEMVTLMLDKESEIVSLRYFNMNNHTTERKDYTDDIKLIRQECNFGNFRYYFACPRCKKKVSKLYYPKNRAHFYCRTCHNLTYYKQKRHNKVIDKLLKMTRFEAEMYIHKKFKYKYLR